MNRMRFSWLLFAALVAASRPGQAVEPTSNVRVEISSAGVTGLDCRRRPFRMEWTRDIGQRYRQMARETFTRNPDPRVLALGFAGMILMAPIAVLAVPADLAAAPLRRQCDFELRVGGRLSGWADSAVGGERLVLEGDSMLASGFEGISAPRYRVTRTTGTADAEGRFALSVEGRVGRSSAFELRWLVDERPSGTMSLCKHWGRFSLSEPEAEFGSGAQTMETIEIRPSRADRAGSRAGYKTFSEDGRAPIGDLYDFMDGLEQKGPWVMETVFVDQGFPMRVLHTRRKGPALWIIAGIHGEEPAPPNALYRNADKLDALAAAGIPVVLFPLCNPVGYSRNWRYPDVAKYSEKMPGHSLGDSDHLLSDKDGKPRAAQATSAQAAAFTSKVLEMARDYPPALSLDMHEDNLLEKGYLYSQGRQGREDEGAKAIVERLKAQSFPILLSGKTRFDETIVGGIVSDVNDGSIDELIAAEKIWSGGAMRKGPAGRSVIVVETSAKDAVLSKRIRVHAAVLGIAGELYRRAAAAAPK